MLKYCKYLIVALLLINNAFAQQVKPDTTNLNFNDEDEFDVPDTTHSNINYIPEDIMFIPSGLLYDYQWDNKNIRFRKIVPGEKKDTTLIIFNNTPDNNFYFPIKGKLISPFGSGGIISIQELISG